MRRGAATISTGTLTSIRCDCPYAVRTICCGRACAPQQIKSPIRQPHSRSRLTARSSVSSGDAALSGPRQHPLGAAKLVFRPDRSEHRDVRAVGRPFPVLVAGRLAVKDDGLRLGEGKETLHPALASKTGLLEAAERDAEVRFEAILAFELEGQDPFAGPCPLPAEVNFRDPPSRGCSRRPRRLGSWSDATVVAGR
jgi:hypothetical protein